MRLWPAALVLALTGSLSACGAGGTPSADPGGARALSAFTAGAGSSGRPVQSGPVHRFALPTSSVVVASGGVSWLQGTTLHVGGRRVDTGVRAQGYTLLPSGVLLYRDHTLLFTDTRSAPRRVADGVVGPGGVRVSSDRRYVGFLDARYGPTDDTGAHFPRLDVLDTRTGRQVLASVAGLGDLDRPVAGQYPEADPALVAMGEGAAYVRGVEGVVRVPYDGSAASPVRPAQVPWTRRGGPWVGVDRVAAGYRVARAGTGPRNSLLSPSRRVGLADTRHFRFAPFDVRTGAPLEVSPLEGTNSFALGGWLPGGDFWGFAFQGLGEAVRGTGQMTVCSLDDGDCTAASGRITASSRDPLLVGG